MQPLTRRLTIAAALLLLAVPGHAQDHHTGHAVGPAEVLGTIDFPNSGAAAAQDPFIRGVLLLHSFEYEDARAAFREARRADPSFALAYWGEAMTHNHPLWYEQDRAAALEVLAALAPTRPERRARAQTERERMYMDAVEELYAEGDRDERDLAHMDAFRRLHEAYPDDHEAAAFHALAVLGSVPERDFRTYMRAAAIAEVVFAANPEHPGAAHYLIHSYDDAIHAPLGLRAARRYAEITPSASHAQHMVSHIYTALGMWDDVVAANREAVRISEDRLRRMGRPESGRNKHALLWLEYGLLQQGRLDEARAVLATMEADFRESPGPGHRWHYAAMRAAFAVADPARADLPPPLPETGGALSVVTMDALATGLAADARGDAAELDAAAARIAAATDRARPAEPREGGGAYAGGTVPDDVVVARIALSQLTALSAIRSADADGALRLLEEAARTEEDRALEYGPPAVVKPTRELLGEILLQLGRHDEAAAAFERALDRYAGRARSVAGLASARAR